MNRSLASLEESALILIDMQQDFLHSSGALRHVMPEMSQESVATLIENNRRAVAAMRRADRPVIFVRVEVRDDRMDHAIAPPYVKNGGLEVKFVIEGSWGATLVDALECRGSDYSIIKKGHGSFQFTNLDRLLSTLRIRDCLYTGGAIGGCVSDTLYQGSALGYRQWLVTDAVYPHNRPAHMSVLRALAGEVRSDELETLAQHPCSRHVGSAGLTRGILVLGMQNDFLDENGKAAGIAADMASQLIARTSQFLTEARERGEPIIHAPFVQRADGNDCAAPLNWAQTNKGRVAVRGTWGARIVSGIPVLDSDLVVERTTLSAFQFTPLLQILRNLGIEKLVSVGGDVQQSLSASVRDAAGQGYEVEVIADLTYPPADPHIPLLANRAAIVRRS